jgi:endonuclease/exonuclease/phosphatase family metal-dependent hydrolase
VTSDTIRVMTWNVHGTFSLNPRFDLDGAIAVIQKWSPHIVALQEIDSRGRNDNPFAVLEDALGGHSVGAKSIVTTDGDYGQMLISRWPWEKPPFVEDISYREREPRRAIAADISTPCGGLRVISTHLGLSIHERHEQAQKLLQLASETLYPAILLGDFNDWFWINSVRGALAERFPVRTRHRSFPSRLPLMRLDRIYGHRVRLVRTFADSAARLISDHLPIIADVASVLPKQNATSNVEASDKPPAMNAQAVR